MSRGGRGGFRGGRGGGFGKIAGADVPWAYDPDLKLDTRPSALFPVSASAVNSKSTQRVIIYSIRKGHQWAELDHPLQPPVPKPLTKSERQQVTHYRALRARVHEGPLYTVLGDNVRIGKQGAPVAAQVDPFEGMPTYTMKYKKKKRKVPKLDTRPYVLKFFPEELWSTLDPDHATQHSTSVTIKRKKLKISTTAQITGIDEMIFDNEDDSSKADEDRKKSIIQSLTTGDEEEEDAEKNPDDEVPEEEDEVDDDFEEDEEDMGGDYDAEQYFDDGGDDGGEDYDDGGGNDDGVY
ncbi:MAG: hypothetical protein M1827_007230 [Pycnora praestabilis]|nr:MAG: hypothetical protein M1827_007230 [Pycnora praestabilis]